MPYGLGIDAGGTYTDAVILEFSTQQVLAKAKALTTRDELSRGVANAINQLPAEMLQRVQLVSLSTTLATNAIVENKGGKVGAILLGFDKYALEKVNHYPRQVVSGRTDISGQIMEELDETALREAVTILLEQDAVDAIAISGMASARNPLMEIRAQEIISGITDKPVVCAHTLTMQLDSIKRTITACLNARLLPIIADLITHVKATMTARNIHAPLMVVRGDGTLMSEETARHTPVETILSGPAASVCGAQVLSGVRDGLVVDIGGTTSDIAVIVDGDPVVTSSGASVADWNTIVRAVDIETVGLGGDSVIAFNRINGLSIGPRRAIPLAYLAHEYPYIIDELNTIWSQRGTLSPLVQPVEFFRQMREYRGVDITPSEERMLAGLANGPRSRRQLAEFLDVCDPSLVPVERLETSGVIQKSTLTPTDIMHVQGMYTAWNRDASEIGLRIFASQAEIDPEIYAANILETFSNRMTQHLLHRVLRHRQPALPDFPHGPANREMLRLICTGSSTLGMTITAKCENPLVAIGAPAQVLAKTAAEKIGAKLIVPEHTEVANAVGAISGVLTLQLEGSVLPLEYGFAAYTPEECRNFNTREEAQLWLHTEMEKLLDDRISEAQVEGFSMEKTMLTNDRLGTLTTGMIFLEYKLRAIAIGRPIFQGFTS